MIEEYYITFLYQVPVTASNHVTQFGRTGDHEHTVKTLIQCLATNNPKREEQKKKAP